MRCKSHGLDPWIRKDPLEKEMATNSSILAWKIGENKEPGGLLFIQLQRVGHDWAYTNTHTRTERNKWRIFCRLHNGKRKEVSELVWHSWMRRETTLRLRVKNSIYTSVQFSSVESLSCVWVFATPWITAHQASLSITNSWSLPKLMSIELVMPSSHLILCHPLLLLAPIPPSIRIFSNKSTLRMRWPEYWSFSFSISPSKEHSALISFRMNWLDLLAVQGTLKSLLQHHSSKASILRCSAFFTVELSHPYMTTGKTIALTRWTFVSKVMSLLLNMLSRLIITFLPRNKHLISWLQSPSAVILEAKK